MQCALFYFFTTNAGLFTRMNEKFSLLSDESLLDFIQQKYSRAFAELVSRHTDRFYRIAYRFTSHREDAEDIVQEAFLKLWERPEIWKQGRQAKFTTWFYRIVINLCLDHTKKKRATPFPEDKEIADSQPVQDMALSLKQQQAMVDHFIRKLPDRQRTALNLCFYEGVSNKEAAEIMGVKVKALQSLIMRAKATLKENIIINN